MDSPTISRLFLYPVKAAAGIEVTAAELDHLGFRHDRRFLVIRPDGTGITQRENHRLALIRTAIDSERMTLTLAAPGLQPLVLPLEPDQGEPTPVSIWSDRVEALAPSRPADAWLTDALGEACRLVYFARTSHRPVEASHAVRPTDEVAFADGYPLLLLSQASLDELDERLDARGEPPLPMDRFRPNIVVTGTEPHAEDGWRRIAAGDMVLHIVKPCERCVVTTIDQATAVAAKEPLRTLATYRKIGGGVLFGQNVIHEAPGALSVGTPIRVLEVRSDLPSAASE